MSFGRPKYSNCHSCETIGYHHHGQCDSEGSMSKASPERYREMQQENEEAKQTTK